MSSYLYFRFQRIGDGRRMSAIALAGCVLLLPGCAERRQLAAPRPWTSAAPVRPHIPVLAPGYVPPSVDDDAPELLWEIPEGLSKLASARNPARPRVAIIAPVENNSGSQPETLSLAPQLSSQEVAVAQRQMNESISAAETSLTAAKARQLNPTQTDLVAKIHSFIQDSREAARGGDWNRARNLAKKAQVLGDELAGSL